MSDMEDIGALDTPKDAGEGPRGVVQRWRLELKLADKVEKDWRERAKKTVQRYRDEKDNKARSDGVPQVNILFSNVQTIMPSLYAKTPSPDIRRRYRDDDPVGAKVSEILERAAEFMLDDGMFDRAMYAAVFDRCVPGRAVTRVRYVPDFDGEGMLSDEAIEFEPWPWEDFRRGPGRRWDDVTWIAFRHWLTVDEGVEQFGEGFKQVEPDAHPEGVEEDGPDQDTFKRVEVWEIWCKNKREVVFIAPRHEDGPLKVVDDPLNLKHFFPIPKPLYAVEDSTSLVPVEEYRMYRDQAEELNRLTTRITRIIEVLKVRGVADSKLAELWNLEDKEDGEFVPAEDVTQYLAGGGLDNAIWMLPIDKMIAVLQQLYVARDQVKQVIYEITGISDILRGASDARETASAQTIKAQWGSVRLQRSQREVQRYARDLIRIAVEIVAEQFDPETLARMTGVDVATDEQKMMALAEAQQGLQQAQMAAQAPPEAAQQAQKAMQEAQGIVTWSDCLKVMRSDLLRAYKVDIETDSTIEADEQADRQARNELVQTILGTMLQGLQVAAAGPELAPVIKDSMLYLVRGMKDGRALESSIEDNMDRAIEALEQSQQQQGQPDPAEQAKAQADMAKAQATVQKSQVDMQRAQIDAQKAQQDAVHTQHEHQYKMQELQAGMEKMAAEVQAEREQRAWEREQHAMEMQALQAKVEAQIAQAEVKQQAATNGPQGNR